MDAVVWRSNVTRESARVWPSCSPTGLHFDMSTYQRIAPEVGLSDIIVTTAACGRWEEGCLPDCEPSAVAALGVVVPAKQWVRVVGQRSQCTTSRVEEGRHVLVGPGV